MEELLIIFLAILLMLPLCVLAFCCLLLIFGRGRMSDVEKNIVKEHR